MLGDGTKGGRRRSTLTLGVVLLLSGWAIIGLGALLFPTSNLLGGLGILGALLNAIGIVILVIALIAMAVERLTQRTTRG